MDDDCCRRLKADICVLWGGGSDLLFATSTPQGKRNDRCRQCVTMHVISACLCQTTCMNQEPSVNTTSTCGHFGQQRSCLLGSVQYSVIGHAPVWGRISHPYICRYCIDFSRFDLQPDYKVYGTQGEHKYCNLILYSRRRRRSWLVFLPLFVMSVFDSFFMRLS